MKTTERGLAEVDEKIQSLETELKWLQGHRKEVVETRERHLVEVDEKIQSITEEMNACQNELSKLLTCKRNFRLLQLNQMLLLSKKRMHVWHHFGSHNDANSFFLISVNMTIVHLGHIKFEN